MDGVKLDGKDGGALLGGVCARVPSFTLVVREDCGKLLSGDNVGGVACGIVFSKSSALSRVEKVRFASSAGLDVSIRQMQSSGAG